MDEKDLYVRKATVLKRALRRAVELDAEDALRAKVRPVYELESGQELADNEYDAMEELLVDDKCETDWNLEDGVPPPGFWSGTHDRFGKRIPGFTEDEYLEGEEW